MIRHHHPARILAPPSKAGPSRCDGPARVQRAAAHQPKAPLTRRRKAFTLIELLVVLAIIGILLALLLPAVSRSRLKARNAVCVSQLRQLGVAVRLYADDNDSRLPIAERLPSLPLFPNTNLPCISDVLGPYAGKAGSTNGAAPIFKCPGDNAKYFEVEGSSYLWNISLNGRRIDFGGDTGILMVGNNPTNSNPINIKTNITTDVSATPMLLDYDDFHPRPPLSGQNVVYMDNHVAPKKLEPAQ